MTFNKEYFINTLVIFLDLVTSTVWNTQVIKIHSHFIFPDLFALLL